jgi:hypothetical protein
MIAILPLSLFGYFSFIMFCCDISLAESNGRSLFHGFIPFSAGNRVTNIGLPESFSACSNCHGKFGTGGTEGGVFAPSIQWPVLMHERNSKPGYSNKAAVLLAVTKGVGSNGSALSLSMPRYNLTESESEALFEYLKYVGTDSDLPPGVSLTTIKLGVVLPLSGPSAPSGKAALLGIKSEIEKLNRNGGIFGRYIILLAQDGADNPSRAVEILLRKNIYVLLGSVWDPKKYDVEEQLTKHHVNSVASLVFHSSELEIGSLHSDLLPSRIEQTKMLEAALADCDAAEARWTLVEPVAKPSTYNGIKFFNDAEDLATALASAPAKGCIAYDVQNLRRVESLVPPAWKHIVVLPFPSSLLKLQSDEIWQSLGQVSARITIELLAKAGAHLHEASLAEELSKLEGFEPLPGLPVNYTKQRRHAWNPELVKLNGNQMSPVQPQSFVEQPQ